MTHGTSPDDYGRTISVQTVSSVQPLEIGGEPAFVYATITVWARLPFEGEIGIGPERPSPRAPLGLDAGPADLAEFVGRPVVGIEDDLKEALHEAARAARAPETISSLRAQLAQVNHILARPAVTEKARERRPAYEKIARRLQSEIEERAA